MDLGEYFPCLNVKDLARSIAFYEKLNFALNYQPRRRNLPSLRIYLNMSKIHTSALSKTNFGSTLILQEFPSLFILERNRTGL